MNALRENGHEFVAGSHLGFDEKSILHWLLVCKQCGIVRRRDGKSNPCKGNVKAELRGKR